MSTKDAYKQAKQARSGDFPGRFKPDEFGDKIAGQVTSIEYKDLDFGPTLVAVLRCPTPPTSAGVPVDESADDLFEWILSADPSDFFMDNNIDIDDWVAAMYVDDEKVGKSGNSKKVFELKHGDSADDIGITDGDASDGGKKDKKKKKKKGKKLA